MPGSSCATAGPWPSPRWPGERHREHETVEHETVEHETVSTGSGPAVDVLTAPAWEAFRARWRASLVVSVGLDPTWERLPEPFRRGSSAPDALVAFNREIIDATHDLACAFKPNTAFYERYGSLGWRALEQTAEYLRTTCPQVPLIVDAKRADIGSTNAGYVASLVDGLGAAAVTVSPYLGREALQPFLERERTAVFVLAKTSNPGAGELQDLPVGPGGRPLFELVASQVAEHWNSRGNCGLVVGATYPEALRAVRAVAGDLPLLVPGVGAQGGSPSEVVAAARDSTAGGSRGAHGVVVNASRGICYASSDPDRFADEARRATVELTEQLLGGAG